MAGKKNIKESVVSMPLIQARLCCKGKVKIIKADIQQEKTSEQDQAKT